jgi:hypothetical protein
MRAASRFLSTGLALVGLTVFLPASSRAGTITIVDLANDTISFTTDSGATTSRLVTTNCPGSEAIACIFGIHAPTGTAATTIDHSIVSLMEPPLATLASDNLHLTDAGGGVTSSWSFVSSEGGIAPLIGAFTLTENGTPQTVVTLTYLNSAGGQVGTDTILIQSDLDTTSPVPEPASASLMVLGAGLLFAAGRWRKRIRG